MLINLAVSLLTRTPEMFSAAGHSLHSACKHTLSLLKLSVATRALASLLLLLLTESSVCCVWLLQVFSLTGVSCWRCGKRGHLSKDCSEPDARPCVYCARYGHEGADCPDSKQHAQQHTYSATQPPLQLQRSTQVSPPVSQPLMLHLKSGISTCRQQMQALQPHNKVGVFVCLFSVPFRDLFQLQRARSQAGGLPLCQGCST